MDRKEAQDELLLIKAVLKGYEPSMARNDALRAVHKLIAQLPEPVPRDRAEVIEGLANIRVRKSLSIAEGQTITAAIDMLSRGAGHREASI